MSRAFTLIELLVVITIIGILAALTLGAGSSVMEKSKRSRAQVEVAGLDTALGRYKIDNGDFPSSDLISSSGGIYGSYNESDYTGNVTVMAATGSTGVSFSGNGGRFVFACLTGRAQFSEQNLNKVGTSYIDVKRNQVGDPDALDRSYFKDPYNRAYGYYYDVTSGTKALFNIVEPDVWSVGNTKTSDPAPSTNSNSPGYSTYLKWIKNWAGQ